MYQKPKCKSYDNKPLEENIGQKLHETEFGSDFLDVTPKAEAARERTDKSNFMKFVNCVHQKTLSRVKRQPKEWEKISANHRSDKGLTSRI